MQLCMRDNLQVGEPAESGQAVPAYPVFYTHSSSQSRCDAAWPGRKSESRSMHGQYQQEFQPRICAVQSADIRLISSISTILELEIGTLGHSQKYLNSLLIMIIIIIIHACLIEFKVKLKEKPPHSPWFLVISRRSGAIVYQLLQPSSSHPNSPLSGTNATGAMTSRVVSSSVRVHNSSN